MWQPIETAPKDQTFLAVLNCAGQQTICTMRWAVAEAKNSRPDNSAFHVERVTHWMPLPALPGAQAQPAPSVPTALLVAIADLVTQMEIVSRVGFVDTPDDKDSCAAFCVAEGTWQELVSTVESLASALASAPEAKP